jgi:secondary thiamine-phosphate synthase enzyme
MAVVSYDITLQSKGDCDIIDITSQVAGPVAESGIDSGVVTLFVVGSTAGITTIEYEPNLLADFRNMWERIAPRSIAYQHDRAWGDGNGHSHVRASILGPSLVVPFANKRLTLGTWQQIVFVDFDNRPRSRRIVLQILGE